MASATGTFAAPPARRKAGWSRTVGLLRILLPTVALSLVALVIVWAQRNSGDQGFRIGFSLLVPEDGRQISMVNPRYAGRNKDRQPYLVTATTAVQSSPGADTIELTNPKGDLTLKSGAWVALAAPAGNYSQKAEILNLRDGVNLFHDSGLEFNTPTAAINLKESSAFGKDSVVGHGPAVDIASRGFRVLDGGSRVIFTGKAQLTLYPRKASPAMRPRPAPPGDDRK